jgi:hypothetical protein
MTAQSVGKPMPEHDSPISSWVTISSDASIWEQDRWSLAVLGGSILHSLDACAELPELLIDALVAALNLDDVADA